MKINIDRIKKDLDAINAFNATPGAGFTRLTFSPEYVKALGYIREQMEAIGARMSVCRGGNVKWRFEGKDPDKPAVMLGSHIDTVIQGGAFDGLLGVVAAMEACRVISDYGANHSHPIELAIFAEEEGARFGPVLVGSRAWVGQLADEDLGRLKDKNGISYLKAIEASGLHVEDHAVLNGKQIKAMLELHVEQSVVLDREGFSVGLVEEIAGIKQFGVTIRGIANHAGSTPMAYRYDALQGGARIVSAVEEVAKHKAGKRTVGTVGSLNCQPGLANVIPEKVQMTIDIRDPNSEILDKAASLIKTSIESICKKRGLKFDARQFSDTPPVLISDQMTTTLGAACKDNQVEPLRMFSGAVHDSCIVADITDIGMIFVPSKEGKSHCAEEHTDYEHMEKGAQVLMTALHRLAA